MEKTILRRVVKHTNIVSLTCYNCGYSTKQIPKSKTYSNSVFIPKTKFPIKLENNKLIERDQSIYETASFENLYDWQRSHLSEPEFILHDGPPYANGQAHMGHAINKILKDAILRCHILKGNKVHYIPGWDCHGLPIELKAISDGKDIDPMQIRRKGRKFAEKAIEDQMQAFKSWGVIGDWKNAYKTYSKDYMKVQMHLFYKMYNKNLIYRDIKPIHWSPSSRTALAEAEIEYNENHVSPSLYVQFQISKLPNIEDTVKNNVYAIIWTTTPWTLPANHAVSYNEDLMYNIIRKSNCTDGKMYIVASDLLEDVSKNLNINFEVVKEIKGHALEGAKYIHPIYSNECSFVNSLHATASKGTGLVHTAGSHGPDDFLVALKNKLPLVDLVDDAGCFNSKAGHNLEGKHVLTDGNEAVLEILKDNVMHVGKLTHSYPYDWRTKKPLIIKASQQWFIDTNALKEQAIESLNKVTIIPKDRGEIYRRNLINQIQKRPYWCISRQRKWGVPIPVIYDDHSEKIINEHTISHHCNLLGSHGPDFWWQLSNKELLPDNLHSSYNLDTLERSQDILDIWFDSGISWAKVLDGSKVADVYLEGVDQFTGWFQSSLLTSVALREKAPYKTIYVHGYAVDSKGVKMSKSVGNVVNPGDIMKGCKKQKPYGVDVLRWWVTCHANQDALAHVSITTLESCKEELHKIRNVLKFALGGISDYKRSNSHEHLLLIDMYMLHLLHKFHTQMSIFMENYEFHKISKAVLNLLTNPISALYYTAIKDRLYCDQQNSSTRRAAQYILLNIFEIVSQVIAPMVPHLAEEMYQYFPFKEDKTYFTSEHIKPNADWENDGVEEIMNRIMICKKEVTKELGPATTDKNVEITFPSSYISSLEKFGEITDIEQQIADIMQVAAVKLIEDDSMTDFRLNISKSIQFLCQRCRKIRSDKEEELCKRCCDVVETFKENVHRPALKI